MNMNDFSWENVEIRKPKFIPFKKIVGNSIIGKLVCIEKKDSIFRKENYYTYFIKNFDGNIEKINSTIELQRLMENISIGDMIQITYLGSIKTINGNNMDKFEVMRGLRKHE